MNMMQPQSQVPNFADAFSKILMAEMEKKKQPGQAGGNPMAGMDPSSLVEIMKQMGIGNAAGPYAMGGAVAPDMAMRALSGGLA